MSGEMGAGNLRKVRYNRQGKITVNAGGSSWTHPTGETTFRAGQQVLCLYAGDRLRVIGVKPNGDISDVVEFWQAC